MSASREPADAGRLAARGTVGTATWLELSPDPVFAVLHAPRAVASRATAVLIVPPFGWDEVTSHRSRRDWALALAAAGHPAALIDLPGAGDSGGSPRDGDRVGAWVDAVLRSSAWLLDATGATRLAVIGIGLGGLLCCRALADGAPIDDLILWAVKARGGALVRDLRMHSGIVAAAYPEDADGPPVPGGALELTGFYMGAETQAALDAIRLEALALGDGAGRRALLLGRDELGVDRRLQGALAAAGIELTELEVDDYERLMAEPDEGQFPEATVARSIEWLGAGDGRPPAPRAVRQLTRTRAADAIELEPGGVRIRESPLALALSRGATLGVLSEPAAGARAGVCAVMLNPGALRRIGTNRMWVETARRWAARGVPSVRVDLEAIGDADGDDRALRDINVFYARRYVDAVIELLAELRARGVGERFALVGFCASAYWSLHAALADPSVAAVFSVNQYTFFWAAGLTEERTFEQIAAVVRSGVIRRLRSRGLSREELGRIRDALRYRLRAGRPSVESAQAGAVVGVLDRLRDQGTMLALLLSRKEPLYPQLQELGVLEQPPRWPNVTLERLPSADHMLRAIWVQADVAERLDRGLELLLASRGEQ
jgi:pimeloyl-ACP methyl ester carboxylesterase